MTLDVFKGWRRKAGVITLGLACIATVFWVRSYRNGDLMQLGFGRMHLLHSTQGTLRWMAWAAPADQPQSVFAWMPYDVRAGDKSLIVEQFRTDLPKQNIEFREAAFSYWTIAVPPTLLSAYLLLSKPRQKNQLDDAKSG